MHLFRIAVGALAALALSFSPLTAAAPAAPDPAIVASFQSLVQKVQAKLQAGQTTEKDLAPELKEFDALAVEAKAKSPDLAAQILLAKAGLYVQVLENPAQAAQVIKQIKADYPATAVGQNADKLLASLDGQIEAAKAQAALAVGQTFPAFDVKDLNGQPLTIAQYAGRGKVVLIDFWAVWCGPCVAELPNVLATYKKYHDKGFNIIGISLDEDKAKLEAFIKEQNMTWPQFYDGKGWKNELAVKYGIQAIPATFLLDGEGKVIARNLRGPALEQAVAAALAKP